MQRNPKSQATVAATPRFPIRRGPVREVADWTGYTKVPNEARCGAKYPTLGPILAEFATSDIASRRGDLSRHSDAIVRSRLGISVWFAAGARLIVVLGGGLFGCNEFFAPTQLGVGQGDRARGLAGSQLPWWHGALKADRWRDGPLLGSLCLRDVIVIVSAQVRRFGSRGSVTYESSCLCEQHSSDKIWIWYPACCRRNCKIALQCCRRRFRKMGPSRRTASIS